MRSIPADHARAAILVALYSRLAEVADLRAGVTGGETPVRVIRHPDTRSPELQLLSNGRYHVMLTNSGGGYSRWKDLAVTRWREDGTCDAWGQYGCGQRPPSRFVSSSAVCATSGPSCLMRTSGRRDDGPASEIAPSGSACSS